MFPTGTIIAILTDDRLREAETARLARRAVADQQPQRRARRLRAVATRIAAFSTMR